MIINDGVGIIVIAVCEVDGGRGYLQGRTISEVKDIAGGTGGSILHVDGNGSASLVVINRHKGIGTFRDNDPNLQGDETLAGLFNIHGEYLAESAVRRSQDRDSAHSDHRDIPWDSSDN